MPNENRIQAYKNLLAGKRWLLLLAALAILLLLLGGSVGKGESTAVTDAEIAEKTAAYRRELEERLAALCAEVEGAGRVSVMITLDGTARAVYATDTRGDGKSDYVVSGGKGLLLSHAYPDVVGVAIVCDGGGSAVVTDKLTRLSAAALGIGTNRIYVSTR